VLDTLALVAASTDALPLTQAVKAITETKVVAAARRM
jgi:hypothetical protein